MSFVTPMVRPMVRPMVTAMGKGGQRTPAQIIQGLFAAGQQGFWLPFTDFASLSQDSAGTLPYTALEQPVGRVLDRSGRGNHASQVTSTARGVVSARVNLLDKTEFVNGVLDAPIRDGALSATTMDGYAGALAFGSTATYAYMPKQLIAGIEYVMSVDVIMDDGLPPVFTGTEPSGSGASFVMVVGGVQTPPTQVFVTPIGGGVYRVKAQVITTAANQLAGVSKYAVQTRTFKVSAYDLRPASQAGIGGTYQRVTTATDYDSVGFPKYLRLDGTDDFYTCGGGGSTTGFYYSDVIRPTSTTYSALIADNTGSGGYLVERTNTGISFIANGGGTIRSVSLPLAVNVQAFVCVFDDGVNLVLRVNDAQTSIARHAVTAGSATMYLGRYSAIAQYFNGQITEPIYRAGPPPSEHERGVIRAYQRQKAGML